MTSPIETAAIPSLVAALEALQAFFTSMGTDPTQFAVKFPGASQVLLGTLELQLPSLASAEIGALQTSIAAQIAAKIKALQTPA